MGRIWDSCKKKSGRDCCHTPKHNLEIMDFASFTISLNSKGLCESWGGGLLNTTPWSFLLSCGENLSLALAVLALDSLLTQLISPVLISQRLGWWNVFLFLFLDQAYRLFSVSSFHPLVNCSTHSLKHLCPISLPVPFSVPLFIHLHANVLAVFGKCCWIWQPLSHALSSFPVGQLQW